MKRIVLYQVFSLFFFSIVAQEAVHKIPNRYYFSVNPCKAIARKMQLKKVLEKEMPVIKKFEEIQQTGIFLIETFNEAQVEQIKEICKKQGIELKQDEYLPMTCTTPPFVANDAWNDMGYWNSLNQNILKEKQLMDSIYWLIKANFWNNANDAGETVDFVLSEIPNGAHSDIPSISSTGTWDYYRNTSVNYANATLHGSETAGVAFAKINNASGSYNGDMAGMTNVKEPMIKNSGIDDSFSSKSAILAAMQACINETNTTGRKQILSISSAITTGIDSDYDLMFNQADLNGKVIFIIGAGNDGNPIGQTLSNFHTSVIVVQAGDGQGNRAGFSTYNAPLSFKGSGRGLVQSGTSGTVSWQGTSLSAPGAAGAAHLLWSLMPNKTAAEIRAVLVDQKNTTTFIANPSGTITPALRIGYLIQNLHFDIVHDYPNPVDAATNSGLLNLTSSVHDIQGGTISNATYWYQQSQTGAWVQAANGILNKQQLGNGRHNVKLSFDIQHQPGKCTEIVRSIQITNATTTSITDPQNPTVFIRITPNPASQLLSITGLSSSKIYQYVLSDYTGRSLLNGNISQNSQQQINISSIPAGVYLLRLYNVKQGILLGTEKIIVAK